MSESKSKVEKDPVASFLTVYNNLPLAERLRVILVFEEQPISWEIARNEIIHNPGRGKEILKKLIELDII